MKLQPLTDEQLQEAISVFRQHGSKNAAANALGIPRKTLEHRIKRAIERGFAKHQDEAIELAMDAVATRMVPGMVWAKHKNEDGTSYSVLLKPEKDAPEDLVARLETAFTEIPVAPRIAAPKRVQDDLMLILPLMDAHVGMHAWGKETGEQDYDLKLAQSDLVTAFEKVDALTPACAKAVLLVGGDYLHADDNTAQTPQSKHHLDVDGRHYKVLDVAVAMLVRVVEALASKHKTVEVRVLRGNHDEHSHLVITFALAARYAKNQRIVIHKDPRDLYMAQWGRAAVFAHHGDRAPPERLTLYVSDVCPFWSETRHRYMLTGHIHKDSSKDVGPLRWESLRAFCPPDAYAAGMGYAGRRALQALVFDKKDGLVLRAIDPIER